MKKIRITLLSCIILNIMPLLFPQNTDFSEFTFVKGGSFMMGSDDPSKKAVPLHEEQVSDFYLSKYKVSLKSYMEVMGYAVSPIFYWWVWGKEPLPETEWDEIPFLGVSWDKAIIYCNRRSVRDGLVPCYADNGSKDAVTYGVIHGANNFTNVSCDKNANGYRLPTEAEWEYAARGGIHKNPYFYSGSDDYEEVVNQEKPYKMGKKKGNSLGIFDMSFGPEWCWDYYAKDYSFRVLRGGSYAAYSEETSSVYYRIPAEAYVTEFSDGPTLFTFRVARNAANSQNISSSKKLSPPRIFEDIEIYFPEFNKKILYVVMTDNYEVLCTYLLNFGYPLPQGQDWSINPSLAQAVRSKMEELKVSYSVTILEE